MSSASRTNGRPPLPLSSLHALNVALPAAGSAFLVCPVREHWCGVQRGLVQAHKPNGRRCPGSAQVIDFDLTPAQHAALSAAAHQRLRATHGTHPVYPVLREGARRAARRIATLAANQHVHPQERASVMNLLEAGWDSVARIPAAPAVHQIAARRAARRVHPAQVVGHGWPEFWLERAELEQANTAVTGGRVPAAAWPAGRS